MRCEDFPCCGHELGCCPSFSDSGEQLDMVCTCGARLPVDSRYSICRSCMNAASDEDGGGYDDAHPDCGPDDDGPYEEWEPDVYYQEDQFLDGEWEM